MSTKRNPKDSMQSTWRRLDRSEWTSSHWFFELLGIHPTNLNEAIPVHPKTDKVPYTPEWQLHRWVIFHALVPLAIHQFLASYLGHNLSAFQAYLFYAMAFKFIAIHELHALRKVGHKTGFLDGDTHERDGVPDVGVSKTVISLLLTSFSRPLFTIFLTYRADKLPSETNWLWLPFEAGLYGIILDFWFYWYHRLMHELPGLWKYHRTHHLTKQPNPLLTLYADHEQELFDIAGIPLLTFFSMRAMGRIASVLYWIGLGRMYAAWGARPRRSPPFATNKLTTDIGRYRRNMELYEKFPKLALGGPTVAWVRAACRAVDTVEEPAFMQRINIPVMFIGAGNDEVVSTRAIADYARRLRGGQILTIAGARHELLQEADIFREQLLAAFDAFVPGQDETV
jgi:sterol desaturase/sphingolipid hydroxylase (fatty acid hydroxylase superfamily)